MVRKAARAKGFPLGGLFQGVEGPCSSGGMGNGEGKNGRSLCEREAGSSLRSE